MSSYPNTGALLALIFSFLNKYMYNPRINTMNIEKQIDTNTRGILISAPICPSFENRFSYPAYPNAYKVLIVFYAASSNSFFFYSIYSVIRFIYLTSFFQRYGWSILGRERALTLFLEAPSNFSSSTINE